MAIRRDESAGIKDGRELSPSVDIVVPVFNEDADLEIKIIQLRGFLKEKFPYRWTIRIVDNGSTDRTPEIGKNLAARWPAEVEYLRLEEKGKGRAIRAGWTACRATILCFHGLGSVRRFERARPVDRAAGLRPLRSGHRVAAPSGQPRPAIPKARGPVPSITASDAQCGFKATTRAAAEELLPRVRDNAWFFDTELLLQARRKGYRIDEVPIQWTEDPGTKVRLLSAAGTLLKGLWRVRLAKPGRATRTAPAPSGPVPNGAQKASWLLLAFAALYFADVVYHVAAKPEAYGWDFKTCYWAGKTNAAGLNPYGVTALFKSPVKLIRLRWRYPPPVLWFYQLFGLFPIRPPTSFF